MATELSQEPPAARGKFFYYAHITKEEWNDWKWQFNNRITNLKQLTSLIPSLKNKVFINNTFRMAITPYYLSLIDANNPNDPIMKQVVPLCDEFMSCNIGEDDPLGEENFSPIPGLIHRYPDRVLMVVSNSCAAYCRHCTRKRVIGEANISEQRLTAMIDYIRSSINIRDVIISGGDPLTLETPVLENILKRVRDISHVEMIRIGTRVLTVMPQRVTKELCDMLSKYHPLWINTHFNHPTECSNEAYKAADRLLKTGIPLNNQSVLLKGINDNITIMKELLHSLMKMRIRPYYLFQCDPIKGAEHFRTPLKVGIEIVQQLRGNTTGLAIPIFVLDIPGGGGKIPLGPEYLMSYEDGKAIVKNYKGNVFEYHDPL